MARKLRKTKEADVMGNFFNVLQGAYLEKLIEMCVEGRRIFSEGSNVIPAWFSFEKHANGCDTCKVIMSEVHATESVRTVNAEIDVLFRKVERDVARGGR